MTQLGMILHQYILVSANVISDEHVNLDVAPKRWFLKLKYIELSTYQTIRFLRPKDKNPTLRLRRHFVPRNDSVETRLIITRNQKTPKHKLRDNLMFIYLILHRQRLHGRSNQRHLHRLLLSIVYYLLVRQVLPHSHFDDFYNILFRHRHHQ